MDPDEIMTNIINLIDDLQALQAKDAGVISGILITCLMCLEDADKTGNLNKLADLGELIANWVSKTFDNVKFLPQDLN